MILAIDSGGPVAICGTGAGHRRGKKVSGTVFVSGDLAFTLDPAYRLSYPFRHGAKSGPGMSERRKGGNWWERKKQGRRPSP